MHFKVPSHNYIRKTPYIIISFNSISSMRKYNPDPCGLVVPPGVSHGRCPGFYPPHKWGCLLSLKKKKKV